MSDYAGKRIPIRFVSPEAIELIEQLPRGFKSMIVESAVVAYLDTVAGKKITDRLIKRKEKVAATPKQIKTKKEKPRERPRETPRETPRGTTRLGNITGDF